MINFNLIQKMLGYRVPSAGGIIGQQDKDTGDSLQRVSVYYSILKLLDEQLDDQMDSIDEGYEKVMQVLEVGDAHGNFRRSGDLLYWGFSPNNCSRDQVSQARITMGLYGDKRRLWDSVKAQFKRFGFHQNTHRNYVNIQDQISWGNAIKDSLKYLLKLDIKGLKAYWTLEGTPKIPDISTPGEVASIIRGMEWKWLYPLLYVLDLPLLLENKFVEENGWDLANMSTLSLIYATKKYPTFISRYAWKNYNKELAKTQINTYYAKENNGIPPLGQLYINLITKES